MSKSGSLTIFFFLLLFPLVALAQDSEQAKTPEQLRRESKLIEQVLADAAQLKLPENRAFAMAQAAAFLCQTDQNRARELFHRSVAELITAQTEVSEITKNTYAFGQLIYGQTPRLNILDAVSRCDPELALEFLTKTRPPKIARLMIERTDPSQQSYINNEISNEQRFINLVAARNPQRAIELLRESLKKGVTYETLPLLKKVQQTDEKTAGKLTEETFQKLIEAKLTGNDYPIISAIHYFLNEFGRTKTQNEKQLEVSETSLRNLVDKISAYWLENSNNIYSAETDGFKLVEKYFPGRAVQIRKKIEQNPPQKEYQEYNRLVSGNSSPEEMIKRAEGFQIYRTSIYGTAARKLADAGQVSQAVEMIRSKFSDDEADNQISSLYYNLAFGEMSKGNFDEAERLIDQIPTEATRFSGWLQLARQVFNKNPEENQKRASAILERARNLIDVHELTQIQINSLVEIAGAYSEIEPERAFQTLEGIVSTLNEYADAYAVVSSFRNEQMQRNGEFQISMSGGFLGTGNLGTVLAALREKDFDRTMRLIDGFRRPELRLGLKLEMIGNSQNGMMGVTVFRSVTKRGG